MNSFVTWFDTKIKTNLSITSSSQKLRFFRLIANCFEQSVSEYDLISYKSVQVPDDTSSVVRR